jgi:hypothetical protein
LLAPALPALCGVLDLKVRHDLARRVYDDHLVMAAKRMLDKIAHDLCKVYDVDASPARATHDLHAGTSSRSASTIMSCAFDRHPYH